MNICRNKLRTASSDHTSARSVWLIGCQGCLRVKDLALTLPVKVDKAGGVGACGPLFPLTLNDYGLSWG